MAEAAGLVLGVIALIGTFKDCVDLFSYISAARSLDRDYEVLNTKLDVEKTLLLQWAERVRLVKPQYDERLDDHTVQTAIARILASVQLLLSESKDLQHRYGLQQVKHDEKTKKMAPTISGPRMTRFIREFEELNFRIGEDRESVSPIRKVRWAIHDKAKFDGLIRELSYFISKLNDLVPVTRKSMISMAEEDVERIRSSAKLQLVIDASSMHERIMADLAEQTLIQNCERRVLQRLWFRKMDDRRDDVATPHYQTLGWALEPSHTEIEWDDLSEWLRSGSGIYWLSGKAGSGKSTLMKYIYSHTKTKILLSSWADNAALTLASFFFWNLGTAQQKSQDGLSRALLFNILDSDRSLIPELLPKMWQEGYGSDEGDLSLPSSAEMKQAFEKLGSSRENARNFCFFIDGLDEYSGNYMDGIAFVERLSASPKIKVVVSSRPIPACVEAFSGKPKLRLQDLTKGDIATYVHETIDSHPHLTTLLNMDSDQATDIVKDLVAKASGVFLWVVLACRSLLEGFAAFDRVSDLRRRVDELPPELENLFQHMLSKIEVRYQRQAAKLLRVCHQSHLVSGAEKIASLGLALVDDHDMETDRIPPSQSISNKVKRTKCTLLEGRLRSRCCGLLEIKQVSVEHDNSCFCGCGLWGHDTLIDSTVEFMHRSVFEFLNDPSVWSLDYLQIQDEMFEANSVLSCLSLHLVRLSLEGHQEQAEDYIKDVLLYGVHVNDSTSDCIAPVLSNLEKMVLECGHKSSDPPFFVNIACQDLQESSSHAVLILAVEAGMVDFVRFFQTVNNFALSKKHHDFPLLYHALYRPFLKPLSCWCLPISTEIIRYLLAAGCDPDECFIDENTNENTPWKCWLRQMPCSDTRSALLAAEITELFINAGADLGVSRVAVNETLDMRVKRLFVGGITESVRDRKVISEKGHNLLRLIHVRQSRSKEPSTTQNVYAAKQEYSSLSHTAASRQMCKKRSRSTDASEALNSAKSPRL